MINNLVLFINALYLSLFLKIKSYSFPCLFQVSCYSQNKKKLQKSEMELIYGYGLRYESLSGGVRIWMGNADCFLNLPGVPISTCNSFGPLLKMFRRLEMDILTSFCPTFEWKMRAWEYAGQSDRKRKLGEPGRLEFVQCSNQKLRPSDPFSDSELNM